MISSTPIRTQVFICCSHADARFLKQLLKHLKLDLPDECVDLWDDTRITRDKKWHINIKYAIQSTRVAILLVSADLLALDFFRNDELPLLLSAARLQGVIILSVLLKPCRYQRIVTIEFQFMNKSLLSLIKLKEAQREEVWMDVAEAIIEALNAPLLPPTQPPSDVSIQQRRSRSSTRSADDRESDEESIRDRNFLKISKEKINRGEYDVFLCYNSEDKLAVTKIREQLKKKGYAPWLDSYDLIPGQLRQHQIQKQIENSRSAAVFIGKDGIEPWQQMEIEALLNNFIKRGCPIIPVLLEDAPRKPALPPFLEGMVWVDFRKLEPVQVPLSLPKLPPPLIKKEGKDEDGSERAISHLYDLNSIENYEIKVADQDQQKDFNENFVQEDDLNSYLDLDPIELLICSIEAIPPSTYQSHATSSG